jgi:serine/threonine-protein kinase
MEGRGRVGTVIGGRWQIVRRLATGGMSTVYAAVHKTTRFRVAVKILNLDASGMPEVRERFEREAAQGNEIEHEGVVKAIDDGETPDGCPYIVLELLEGDTLEELRARAPDGRMPVGEVVDLGLAIADVLAAAHDAGLVHRDVKPANVIVTKNGAVKLLDFGVAGRRQLDDDETGMTGFGCGTPRFMSPEQITGSHRIDARADVFALATTMYRAITGVFPFPASTLGEYMLALRRVTPKRVSRLVPDSPAALDDVLARALATDPEARYVDARAFAAALAEAMKPAPPLSDEKTISMSDWQERTAVMHHARSVQSTTMPSISRSLRPPRQSSAPAIAALAVLSFMATIGCVLALKWPAIRSQTAAMTATPATR